MRELAEKIVEEFESNYDMINYSSNEDAYKYSELIILYLSAKNFLDSWIG